MTTNQEAGTNRQSILAEVALIDAQACAAAGAMSVSWWHAEVAAGRAPQPVIRRPRCTRWRLSEVHSFWVKFAENGRKDTESAEKLLATTNRASRAARAKRAASPIQQA